VQAIYQKEMTPLEGAEKLFAGMGIDHNLLAGGNHAEKN